MIGTFGELSWKYMKVRKKRTLLNMVGILLAAALIAGTGTIIKSMEKQFVARAIGRTGNFHVCFKNVTPGQARIIEGHLAVERSCSGLIDGFAVLAETGDGEIPYRLVRLNRNDRDALEMQRMGDRIIRGRLPDSPGEIALDGTALDALGPGIDLGSRVTLRTGRRYRASDGSEIISPLYPLSLDESEEDWEEIFRFTGERTFLITGEIGEPVLYSANYSSRGITYGDTEGLDKFNMLLLLKDPSRARETAEALAEQTGISGDDILYNSLLLDASGYSVDDRIGKSIGRFRIMITAIIILAAVAVIYNSFNISLIERIGQLGIIGCAGGTPAQIRGLILREAALMAALAIPPGIAAGLFAMKGVFLAAERISRNLLFRDLEVVIDPGVILSSALLCFAAVLLSALFPALRASRISPIEAVRRTGYSRRDPTARAGKSLRPVFSFPLLMGWRSAVRNRSRFLVTLFSMAVSVALYVSFGGMLALADRLELVGETNFPGIALSREKGIEGEILSELAARDDVDLVIPYGEISLTLLFPEAALSPAYRELTDSFEAMERRGNSLAVPESRVLCYGNGALAEMAGIPLEEADTAVYLVGRGLFRNAGGRRFYAPPAEVGKGLGVTLLLDGGEKALVLDGMTDDVYYGDYNGTEGALDIVVGERVYAGLTGKRPFSRAVLRLKPGAGKEDITGYLDQLVQVRVGYEYVDAQARAEDMAGESRAISLFFYGFIAVIALIGSLNVINTVSTGVILRFQEYGIIQSVGMDRSGLGKMVMAESLIYSSAALLLGSAAGSVIWYFLVRNLGEIRETVFFLPWREILLSAGVLSLLTLLCGIIPMGRLFSRSIIENIRLQE